MEKNVGYLEGVSPELLSKIAAKNIGTFPVANEWDSHGKKVHHLEKGDADLVIGHLHKLIPHFVRSARVLTPYDMLYPCKTFNVPVLVVAAKETHSEAKKLLGKAAEIATLVDPADLERKAWEILGL